MSGSSAGLLALETTLHQDLNGDGVIGPVATVIESAGSTSLEQIANNYYLYTGGSGPSLKSGGVPIVVGQCSPYTPIGAEQTSTGYDVAFKAAGADQYVVWSTDASGNYVSTLIGPVSGSTVALESFETTLHQDLNGDGTIGPGMQPAIAPAAASPNGDAFVFAEYTPAAASGTQVGSTLGSSEHDDQSSHPFHELTEQVQNALETTQGAAPHHPNDPWHSDGHLIGLMASHFFHH